MSNARPEGAASVVGTAKAARQEGHPFRTSTLDALHLCGEEEAGGEDIRRVLRLGCALGMVPPPVRRRRARHPLRHAQHRRRVREDRPHARGLHPSGRPSRRHVAPSSLRETCDGAATLRN